MSFDVGVATFDSAEPHSRHRIATSVGPTHAYLFDLWDSPPAWFDVPATDLQPKIARMLIDAAEAGVPNIEAVVERCHQGFAKLRAKAESLYAGSGGAGAFVTFPAPDQIEIGWIGDARVYQIADEVRLLTEDHSLINDYLKVMPDLTEAQLSELPAGIITRGLGFKVEDEAQKKMLRPTTLACTLAIGEWLVIVPAGVGEAVLRDPRLRTMSPEAAAKFIVARVVQKEPNRCAGAIVVRRNDPAHGETSLIRELIAKCPDAATESVIADYCEENGRRELLPWLRSENADVRICAVRHLESTLEPGLSAAAFRTANRLAHALGAKKWSELGEQILTVDRESRTAPRAYFATEITLVLDEEYRLRSVIWALAAELLDAQPLHVADRVLPLAEMATQPCSTCGQPAFVVGQDLAMRDGAGDYNWWTEAYTLCVRELHVDRFAVAGESYQPASK